MVDAFLPPLLGRAWGWCQGKTSASRSWSSATSRPTMSTLDWFWGLVGSCKNHGNSSLKLGYITVKIPMNIWYNMVLHLLTNGTADPRVNFPRLGRIPVLRWQQPWFPGKVFPCIDWVMVVFCILFAAAGWSCFFGERATWCTCLPGWAALMNVSAMWFYACLFTPESLVCFRGVGRDPTHNAHAYRGTHGLEVDGCN